MRINARGIYFAAVNTDDFRILQRMQEPRNLEAEVGKASLYLQVCELPS